jgi:hypothetical protein
MKNTFKGYIRPTEEEFNQLWENCLFVPDANVLLDLYRFSEKTRNELMEVFESIKLRIWLPHQAGKEFFDNRPEVILDQCKLFDKAKEWILNISSNARKESSLFFNSRPHPSIEKEKLMKKVDCVIDEMVKDIDEKLKIHPNLLKEDPILERILNLMDGKIGKQYEREREENIFKEGKERYKSRVPPGYCDAEGKNKKEGNKEYGDLILWFQILDKAKEAEKPIIFVTSEEKEDWWWVCKGKGMGPRPELIQEFREKANADFYMYNPDRFLTFAKQFINAKVDKKAIEEVHQMQVFRLNEANSYLNAVGKTLSQINPAISNQMKEIAHVMGRMPVKEIQRVMNIYNNIPSEVLQQISRISEMQNAVLKSLPFTKFDKPVKIRIPDDVKKSVREKLDFCYNCQPWDSGEMIWTLGKEIGILQELIDEEYSDLHSDEYEKFCSKSYTYVISENDFICKNCGTTLDETATVGKDDGEWRES